MSDGERRQGYCQRVEMVPLGDGSYRVLPKGKPQRWLWVREAAEELGVSRDAVRDWIRRGKVVARRAGLRKYQVRADSVEKFARENNHLE